MKNLSGLHLPHLDVTKISDTIERALASAGLDTTSGTMQGVTDVIRRALSSAGTAVPSQLSATERSVLDAGVVVDRQGEVGGSRHEPVVTEPEAPGTFLSHEFSNRAGTRAYKVYVPSTPSDAPLPMVVMLHGCTQSADDFAVGTAMNRLADAHGLLVVYPEQAAHANVSKCWNWFKPSDQVRDSGEPSLIAGIVRDVATRHRVDERRIFVAGLSAGAAMAVVLGETYPELFAGVGVHSGLPYGSAEDIPSAMAAMKGGRSGLVHLQGVGPREATARRNAAQAVPIIVFHGDRDHTVQNSNGAEIVRQATLAHTTETGADLQTHTERGTSPGGRSYTRALHTDAGGRPRVESWTLHGAGHAWSGGRPGGSYTDGTGPDASAEMVRFFLAQPRAGTA